MIREAILIASYLAVGLTLYMGGHNFLLWRRFKVERRWGYALAYISFSGLLWEVATFAIAPAPSIDPDWKTILYLILLVGAIIGIGTISYDHYQRRQRGHWPPVE